MRVQAKCRLGSVQDEGCRLTQQVNDRFSVCDWSAPRENVSRRPATSRTRSDACCAKRKARSCGDPTSVSSWARERLPTMALSRLLKSCASPPRQNAEGFHLLRFQSRYIEQMVFGCDPRQIRRSAHQFLLEACWNPQLTWEIAKVPKTLSDCEMKGVDQQAHTLKRSATSRKSAHSGSVDTSVTNTRCPTNAAVPQDAAHSPISKPSRIFMYSGETLGPAADRRLLP